MKKLYAQRLATLAYNGEKNNLGHRKFTINDWLLPDKTTECGTVGCMVGGCVHVFPKHWKLGDDSLLGGGMPILRTDSTRWTDEDAEKFFGLNNSEMSHLFIPDSQNVEDYGGKKLTSRSKAKDVAYNIWEFLKIKGFKKSDFELKLVK